MQTTSSQRGCSVLTGSLDIVMDSALARRMLAATTEITRVALSADQPDAVLPLVVQRAAELAEADHASTLRAVSAGRVLTVSSDDVVAEVTAQACVRSGLAAVFTDLLDFDGDEVYFTPLPAELVGRTYADALLAPLDITLYQFQRHARGFTQERIVAGLTRLLRGLGQAT